MGGRVVGLYVTCESGKERAGGNVEGACVSVRGKESLMKRIGTEMTVDDNGWCVKEITR